MTRVVLATLLAVTAFTRHPKFRAEDVLKECGEIYPGLFPSHFQFGHDDPIFAKKI